MRYHIQFYSVLGIEVPHTRQVQYQLHYIPSLYSANRNWRGGSTCSPLYPGFNTCPFPVPGNPPSAPSKTHKLVMVLFSLGCVCVSVCVGVCRCWGLNPGLEHAGNHSTTELHAPTYDPYFQVWQTEAE